jgi:hypothetical protein
VIPDEKVTKAREAAEAANVRTDANSTFNFSLDFKLLPLLVLRLIGVWQGVAMDSLKYCWAPNALPFGWATHEGDLRLSTTLLDTPRCTGPYASAASRPLTPSKGKTFYSVQIFKRLCLGKKIISTTLFSKGWKMILYFGIDTLQILREANKS